MIHQKEYHNFSLLSKLVGGIGWTPPKIGPSFPKSRRIMWLLRLQNLRSQGSLFYFSLEFAEEEFKFEKSRCLVFLSFGVKIPCFLFLWSFHRGVQCCFLSVVSCLFFNKCLLLLTYVCVCLCMHQLVVNC